MLATDEIKELKENVERRLIRLCACWFVSSEITSNFQLPTSNFQHLHVQLCLNIALQDFKKKSNKKDQRNQTDLLSWEQRQLWAVKDNTKQKLAK